MLKKQYDEKLAQKEELRRKSEDMEMKLERAGLLVSGLASEKARWEETVKVSSGPPPPARLSSLPARSQSATPCRLRGTRGTWGPPGAGTSRDGGREFSPLLYGASSGKRVCAIGRRLPCLHRPGERAPGPLL